MEKSSPRAKPSRLRPAAWAVCTASSVTPDTAANKGTPAAAAFCAISWLARLVTTMKPLAAWACSGWPGRNRAPMSLSSALCRPTSSQARCNCPEASHQPAAWVAPVALSRGWWARSWPMPRLRAWGLKRAVPPTGLTWRTAWARFSAPHRPQPVRPARLRRWSLKRAKQAEATSMRSVRPAGLSSMSMPYTWSARSTRPSVSEKPSAKSARLSGVASITACDRPLYSSATGRSWATWSWASCHWPWRQRRTGTGVLPSGWGGRWSGFMAAGSTGSVSFALAGGVQQFELGFMELSIAALPIRLGNGLRLRLGVALVSGLAHRQHVHRGHLVLGAVGGPVAAVGGDHIGPRLGEVEGGVDHPGRHALGDGGTQHGLARAALDAHPVAVADAALLGVVRVDLQPVFVVPLVVGGAPGLGPHVVLRQDAAGGQQQGVLAGHLLVGGHVLGDDETPLAAHKPVHMHDGRARLVGAVVAGPLHAAQALDLVVADAGKAGRERGNLAHDLFGVRVVHGVAQGVGQLLGHLPVGIASLGRHHLAHPRDAALGIGEGAVLFKEGRARQEHMCVLGGSLRKMSCTTTHCMALSESITCWVLGSLCTMSSPSQYRPRKVPCCAASNMFGMRRPGSGLRGTPQADSNRLRVVLSLMWR